MKKIISLLLLLVLIVGCSKEELFDVPRDANGNVIFTTISSTTTTGVSTLDGQFSVTATLPNAKSGDVMNVECLQLQIPPEGGTTKQLLPLAGTQKTAAVGADLKATITYTRAEAKMTKATDYVTVVFNGETDYAKARVDMVPATAVSKPKVSSKEVDVARTAETAYFNVTVVPKTAAYTGTLAAKRKNGKNAAWAAITGSPFSGAQPFLVPISGNDFAVGKDTMYYSFTAASGSYTDEILATIIVRDPYFYLKKTATLALGGSSAGRNLLINAAVAENNANAMVAVSGSLILKGGSAWLAAGKTINFVPSTLAMYEANNSTNAIAAFNARVPATTADPIAGAGVYIFKIVNGVGVTNVYYGMMKMTSVLPGVSVTFEYRIGDQYAHLAVIQ
ncbi:MAG: hypothetical protein WC854_07950 [Bacteroidales bacterium]